MLDRLVYWLALGVVTIVRSLPLAICFAFGQAIGVVLWAILPRYRRLARENLASVFGKEMSPAQIRALTFKHFVTLGANAVSAFKMAACSQEEILRCAPIENLDRIKRNIAKGKGVVLAINHIGNWELYAQLVFQVPEARFGTVYQALHNKDLDRLINEDRGKQGVATFDRKRDSTAPSPSCANLASSACLSIRTRATAARGCRSSAVSPRPPLAAAHRDPH